MNPSPRITEHLAPRISDVGGLRVHRVLPKARRRTIGAWCFVDLFDGAVTPEAAAGALATADGVALSPSMDVGPHPHTGLHTVTWLTAGALRHTDSVGSDQVVRPGELNLMTAGWGVAHAEHHVDNTAAAAGAQLWLAQPNATRNGEPGFSHHGELPVVRHGALHATVMIGAHDTERSPAGVDTPAVALALNATDDCRASIALDATNEYCVVVLSGEVVVHGDGPWPGGDAVRPGSPSGSDPVAGSRDASGITVGATTGLDLGLGRTGVTIAANAGSTALVLGGPPLGEDLVMFWNFVARTRAEAATAAKQWNARDPRFGTVDSPLQRIAAPVPPWTQRTGHG